MLPAEVAPTEAATPRITLQSVQDAPAATPTQVPSIHLQQQKKRSCDSLGKLRAGVSGTDVSPGRKHIGVLNLAAAVQQQTMATATAPIAKPVLHRAAADANVPACNAATTTFDEQIAEALAPFVAARR
jgi:hypothetical protein